MILTCPFGRTWTLPGLRSRWTTPSRGAKARPVEDLLHDHEPVLEARDLVAFSSSSPQVAALEQLHGHVGHALLLAEVVDRDDVRVVELGGGVRLALEALARAFSSPLSFPVMILIATSRPSTGSWARNTSPMAPWPSFSTILYLPTWRSSIRVARNRTTRVWAPGAARGSASRI